MKQRMCLGCRSSRPWRLRQCTATGCGAVYARVVPGPVTQLRSAVELVRESEPLAGTSTRIVAIDGLGGAGKSTLAQLVASKVDAQVVHTDDFASWDDPLRWWPRLLDAVLIPLSQDSVGRFQRYDWDSRRLAEWHEVHPGGAVLVEGVSSSRAEFRPYLSASIWIDSPRDVRLRRGLQRDGDGARAQWEEWMAREDEWVAAQSPRSKAVLVLNGDEPWE